MRMRPLAVSLLLVVMTLQAWAYINTDNQTSSTNSNATQNTGLSQQMQQRTTDAEKVFKGVAYKNMAGQNKAGFFAGGGMTGGSSAGAIHSFRIPGNS